VSDWEVDAATPLNALAPPADCPALEEYRAGRLTDAELWIRLGDWQRERTAEGDAPGVIHGNELLAPQEFSARLSLSGHDARIARELLEIGIAHRHGEAVLAQSPLHHDELGRLGERH